MDKLKKDDNMSTVDRQEMKEKSSLRKHFLELLRKQGSKRDCKKAANCRAIILPLRRSKSENSPFYASLPGEVDTFAMIEQAAQLQKQIALPVIERDQRKMVPF